MDTARGRVDRLSAALARLRDNLRGSITHAETASELFDRLGTENRAPRIGGRFQKRDDFIQEEQTRRALLDEELLINRIQQRFSKFRQDVLSTKVFILDDIVRGVDAANRLDLETPAVSEAQIRIEGEEKLAELRDREISQRRILDDLLRNNRSNTEALQATEEFELRRSLEFAESEKDRLEAKAELRRRQRITDIETEFSIVNADKIKLAASKASRTRSQIEIDEAKRTVAELKKEKLKEVSDVNETTRLEVEAIQQRYNILEQESISRLKRIHAETLRLETANARESTNRFNERFKLETQDVRTETRERVTNLPDEIAESDRRRRDFSDSGLNPIERAAARATVSIKDFTRAIAGARRGASEFAGSALAMQRGFTRFGAAIGRSLADINNFINLRWFFIISIVQVLLTFLIQLGAALVAIGASAITAGAALGGALAAGAAQALPVVGLLAAAMNKLEAAMKVVELRQRARDTAGVDEEARQRALTGATDALADAQYNLQSAYDAVGDATDGIKDAHDAVTESVKDQQDAIENLADARRTAAQAIVDASIDERDAELSLREAELGVLDAKQRLLDFQNRQRQSQVDVEQANAAVREAQERLKIAQAQGDQAEIAAASQALSVTQQNVEAVKDAAAEAQENEKNLRISVERSELSVEQARIRRQRAAQENRTRQRQGVEGSPEVESAKDGIIAANKRHADAIEGVKEAEERRLDALHNVEQAERGVARSRAALAIAGDKESAAARNAQREYDKLSAGQKNLVDAMEQLHRSWNSPRITGITDIIVNAIANAMRRIDQLLRDPQILGAFRNLAEVIGEIIDKFSKWAITPEARETIIFFINEAARNLPIIARAAGDFGLALINIAKAASPLFRELVDMIADWGSDLRGVTEDSGRMERFFASAGKHLKDWIELGAAIGDFLLALTSPAAEEGLTMVQELSKQFREWADEMRRDPEGVRLFFESVRKSLEELLPVLANFLGKLVTAFSSNEFNEFTIFILEVMLPAILDLIRVMNIAASIFGAITDIPIVGQFVKVAVQIIILSSLFGKMIPLAKVLFGFFNIRRFLILTALIVLYQNFDKVRESVKRLIDWFDRFSAKFGPLQGIIKALAAVLAGGVGALSLAGALFLVSGRFRGLFGHFDTLLRRVPGLRGVLAGRTGLVGMFGRLGLAGAVAAAGYELSELIRKIPGWEKTFQRFGGYVGGALERFGIGDNPDDDRRIEIEEKYAPGKLPQAQAMYIDARRRGLSDREALGQAARALHMNADDIAFYIPDTIQRRRYAIGGEVDGPFRRQQPDDARGIKKSGPGEEVPIIAHVGEWILNKRQQNYAARLLGTTPPALANVLFGNKTTAKPSHFESGGIPSATKRGEALKGYENRIREVQTTYRSMRREFAHKETMFALKSQYPQIPTKALDAMIPPSYRVRRFLLGGIVDDYRTPIKKVKEITKKVGKWLTPHEVQPDDYTGRERIIRAIRRGGMTREEAYKAALILAQPAYQRRETRSTTLPRFNLGGAIQKFVLGGIVTGIGKAGAWVRQQEVRAAKYILRDPRKDAQGRDIPYSGFGLASFLRETAKSLDPRTKEGAVGLLSVFAGKPGTRSPKGRVNPEVELDFTSGKMLRYSGAEKLNWTKPPAKRPPEFSVDEWRWIMNGGKEPASLLKLEAAAAKKRKFEAGGIVTPQVASVSLPIMSGIKQYALGGIVSGLLGVDTGSSRGKALEGYENKIKEVITVYRDLRRSFPHKESMFALKTQFALIPSKTLEAMIPPTYRLRQFQAGGVIGPSGVKEESDVVSRAVANKQGAPIPILAHVGEWVLNKQQQAKLARRINAPINELKMFLFGTQGKTPNGTGEKAPVGAKGKTKPVGNPLRGPGYAIHPHEDDHGNTVYFAELRDGTWGQVTARAADRIVQSHGLWLPGYVKRANRAKGFNQNVNFGTSVLRQFARGGEVSYNSPSFQSTSAAGTMVRTSKTTSIRQGNTIPQHFEINTQSPTVDIDYIMRVAAMHAEGI